MEQESHDSGEPCGLYIDAENLLDDAQGLVKSLIDEWPSEKAPFPTKVTLYVRADTVELWNAWTVIIGQGIEFEVKGIQHFTRQQSKNSADIAIALDAFCDFVRHKVSHVAVLSDDSDFISLFAKIRTETSSVSTEKDGIPFLWIMTDRDGTKTPNVQRFFPKEYVHLIHGPLKQQPAKFKMEAYDVASSEQNLTREKEIARAIISDIDLGTFKSTDCRKIIERTCPRHQLVGLPSNRFGIEFLSMIWPILEAMGVEKGSSKPVKYKMTQAAKDSLNH